MITAKKLIEWYGDYPRYRREMRQLQDTISLQHKALSAAHDQMVVSGRADIMSSRDVTHTRAFKLVRAALDEVES
jgi:hypothetical protein